MGMISDGVEWLAESLLEEASESVTYTRGANSATVTAIIGRRRPRREEPGQEQRLRLDGEPMDFLVDPVALVVGGSTITPARGDTITWSTRVYHVTPMDGEPEYRSSDPFGHLLRIHTMRKT